MQNRLSPYPMKNIRVSDRINGIVTREKNIQYVVLRYNGVFGPGQRNIQYGSAEWFWKRQINSFVVQVEPERFKWQDRCVVGYTEAIKLEEVRSLFWQEINEIVDKHIEEF